jgi:hypothetical protein
MTLSCRHDTMRSAAQTVTDEIPLSWTPTNGRMRSLLILVDSPRDLSRNERHLRFMYSSLHYDNTSTDERALDETRRAIQESLTMVFLLLFVGSLRKIMCKWATNKNRRLFSSCAGHFYRNDSFGVCAVLCAVGLYAAWYEKSSTNTVTW